MRAKRKKTTVWVVMHYEFMRMGQDVIVDSVQFHVSSSLRRAEKYVRRCRVSSYSWWQVHPHVVDCDDWMHEGEEVHYYNHRGKPLRNAPFKQAMRAYEREQV